MKRRDFLKASLAGVPFLLGFKLPEMTMLEELRVMLYDPDYKFFEDEDLQVHLEQAVLHLDPNWSGQKTPLKELTREVAKDPYLRELALKGAVNIASVGRSLDRRPEAYTFYIPLHEKTKEDYHRLISWWEHRGDERIFRRGQRELGIQMAETARWCQENPV